MAQREHLKMATTMKMTRQWLISFAFISILLCSVICQDLDNKSPAQGDEKSKFSQASEDHNFNSQETKPSDTSSNTQETGSDSFKRSTIKEPNNAHMADEVRKDYVPDQTLLNPEPISSQQNSPNHAVENTPPLPKSGQQSHPQTKSSFNSPQNMHDDLAQLPGLSTAGDDQTQTLPTQSQQQQTESVDHSTNMQTGRLDEFSKTVQDKGDSGLKELPSGQNVEMNMATGDGDALSIESVGNSADSRPAQDDMVEVTSVEKDMIFGEEKFDNLLDQVLDLEKKVRQKEAFKQELEKLTEMQDAYERGDFLEEGESDHFGESDENEEWKVVQQGSSFEIKEMVHPSSENFLKKQALDEDPLKEDDEFDGLPPLDEALSDEREAVGLDYAGKSSDISDPLLELMTSISNTAPPHTDVQPSKTSIYSVPVASGSSDNAKEPQSLMEDEMRSTATVEVASATVKQTESKVFTDTQDQTVTADSQAPLKPDTADLKMEQSSSSTQASFSPHRNIEPSETLTRITHEATTASQTLTQSLDTTAPKLVLESVTDGKVTEVSQTIVSKLTATAKGPDLMQSATSPGNGEEKPPATMEKSLVHDERQKLVEENQKKSMADSEGTQADTQDQHATETPEEKENRLKAQEFFEKGEKLVNNSYKRDFQQAYAFFELAAKLGNDKAREYLGFGYLLGDYVAQDTDKALEIFQDLSQKGSPRGQLGLGFMFSAGLALNSSQAKALIYFTFAALGGDPLGQMVLGYRYWSGIGVETRCESALQFYRKVATTVAEQTSSGSPVVQRVRLQDQAENSNSGSSLMDDDLLQYHQFLADKGDVQAQVVLGQLYYQGARGVPVNHERAHHYFTMAAESDNANAFAFLGKMHTEGSPVVEQDNAIAFQFFKKAADKGNPIGQSGLGMMYLHGKGVEVDYNKAFRYFTLAADQGYGDGQLQLGVMHYVGKGVRRDLKMAVKFFNLASQGGHVLAFFYLAQMHATGTGVLRNCHTAVELYKNVAERGPWAVQLMEAHRLYKEASYDQALLKYTFMAELGYEVAQSNVAYMLDQGETDMFSEKEKYQRALLHWTRAASQGSTTARLKMGDYHYYGYGTEIDYETAASHYRLATEQQHNAQAMFNLGYMHENGLGLKQDVHLAKRFYDMAAETSGDAYVPVTLALIKLALFYGVDVFNKELEDYQNIFTKLDIRYLLGPNWDIFLATFLAILLGLVVVIRRAR